MYTHGVREKKEKEGDGKRDHTALGEVDGEEDNDANYIKDPLLRGLCTSSHLLHHSLVRKVLVLL